MSFRIEICRIAMAYSEFFTELKSSEPFFVMAGTPGIKRGDWLIRPEQTEKIIDDMRELVPQVIARTLPPTQVAGR